MSFHKFVVELIEKLHCFGLMSLIFFHLFTYHLMYISLTCACMFLDQILHVGLVSESNRLLRNAKWGTQEKEGTTSSNNSNAPKQVST